MPRKRKPPQEWTTDEAMRHLFPKKVRDELHRIAHERDEEGDSGESNSSQAEDSTDET
jgi:hypothetical protein